MQRETEQLIDTLTDNLRPVQHPWRPLWQTALFFGTGMVYVTLCIALLGLRSDILNALHTPAFLFEIGLALAISLTAAMAAMWLGLPDCGGRHYLPVIPLSLLGAFLGWVSVQSITHSIGVFATSYWAHCLRDSLVFIFIPLATMLMMNMRARTTSPLKTCAMNVLAISALGWCGLRLTCPIDTVGHGMIYHMLPYAGFAFIAALAARRLFRW